MSQLVINLAILVLAGFAGFLTISKVPNTLHTPLMSGTNAVHGIVLLGGIIVLGLGVDGFLNKLLLVIAIACRPATPAPSTSTLAGLIVPAAVVSIGKKRPISSAAISTAR